MSDTPAHTGAATEASKAQTAAAAHSGDAFEIRPLTADDRSWVQDVLKRYWASTTQVTRGKLHKADDLSGFAAWRGGQEVGLITYDLDGEQCEVVTHNSLAGDGGIGSCLLNAVRDLARAEGCTRLWLVTTNDNTQAMRFYQRRDFDMVALHRDAITEARKLKPEMPEVGLDGIRVRHEIEMEYKL